MKSGGGSESKVDLNSEEGYKDMNRERRYKNYSNGNVQRKLKFETFRRRFFIWNQEGPNINFQEIGDCK